MAKKNVAFRFALEILTPLDPQLKPMFGSHAVYIGEKIVLILRDKDDADSGVWVATNKEHHDSLKIILPCMRSIGLFGSGVSSWQLLPAGAEDFETCVNQVCDLIVKNDPRIGRIPKPRKKKEYIPYPSSYR